MNSTWIVSAWPVSCVGMFLNTGQCRCLASFPCARTCHAPDSPGESVLEVVTQATWSRGLCSTLPSSGMRGALCPRREDQPGAGSNSSSFGSGIRFSHREVTVGLRVSPRPHGLWHWTCRHLSASLIKPLHQAPRLQERPCLREPAHRPSGPRAVRTWMEIMKHSVYRQARSTHPA